MKTRTNRVRRAQNCFRLLIYESWLQPQGSQKEEIEHNIKEQN